ncbi:MAG: primosomal replication protein N [Candidatus Contendobacter sp.]|nr:primosomal replication protein N [Candidatus Contendobacter sp.]
MSSAPPADNCLIIVGQLTGACETRITPAGVPISRFLLEHRSEQREAGLPREARCRIPVVACGDALADIARRLAPDARVRVRGFVSRANHREGEYRLVLHAARIDILATESSEG